MTGKYEFEIAPMPLLIPAMIGISSLISLLINEVTGKIVFKTIGYTGLFVYVVALIIGLILMRNWEADSK